MSQINDKIIRLKINNTLFSFYQSPLVSDKLNFGNMESIPDLYEDLSIDTMNNVVGGPAIEMQGFGGLVKIWKYPCFIKQKMHYENIELVHKGFYLLDEENMYFSPCRLGIENGILNYYFDIYS